MNLDGLYFMHISRMLLLKHRKQIEGVEAMVENESATHTAAVICCPVHFPDAHSAGLACSNWI